MQLVSSPVNDDLFKISLSGRFDMLGNQKIEMKLTSLVSTRKAGVIIDMSEVEFLASIGMRTLITNAKAQANRGGEMVLCSLQPMVKEVLSTSGVDALIRVFDDCDTAISELKEKLN